MNGQRLHEHYLDELVKNLDVIGEDWDGIDWVMKEGVWLKDGSKTMKSLCDLIVVYYGGIGVPIELKGNHSKRPKALKQLSAGKDFIETEVGLLVPYGKFVVYDNGRYGCEVVSYD